MLYRPLFWTSYWCEDWLSLSGYRDASTILISSASAKTAFCLAYLVQKRLARKKSNTLVNILGLTSKRNVAFTKKLGLYTQISDYDSFTSLETLQEGNVVYVDVAGNSALNKRVFKHFASLSTATLKASVALGYASISPSSTESSAVNWDTQSRTDPSSSPSAAPTSTIPPLENFFMVEWLEVRKQQLSISQIFSKQNAAWADLMKDCVNWVELEHVYGGIDVTKAYKRIADGNLGPETGYIWSLWDKEQIEPGKPEARL